MSSIQVVRLLDLIAIDDVREAVGVDPRSIVIKGEDFRTVESVIIDNVASPSFAILNSKTIVAEVPVILRESVLYDVSVFSSSVTLTERSLVELTVGVRPQAVSGALKLMQTFLRILLRRPGSNLFHRTLGGGLRQRVGGNLSSRTAADVQISVTQTKSQIIAAQSGVRQIPPSERLLAAEIVALNTSIPDTSTSVTIVLTSHSRARSGATLIT